MKCSCLFCSDNQYLVDIASFSRKRPCGISGILRVKNDAEFLAESIDSCINALDELIIVYNDCSDESPEIIKLKAKQYCNKIKYYEYEPKVYANNLSDEEYEFIKKQPANSPHLLANYYNYALAKVNYEFVMKIDADQIYLTAELQQICDAYRNKKMQCINPWNFLCFAYFYLNLLLYKKTGCSFFSLNKKLFVTYRECLLDLIRNFKVSIYLSGYNMLYHNSQWYVSLGKKNEGIINILPPYNGVTDHTIFKLSSHTFFAPIEEENYARLNSHKHSLVEIFCGFRVAFPYGFVWMHLNGMRRTLYSQQLSNLNNDKEYFLLFEDFAKKKFEDIGCTSNTIIWPLQSRLLYSILHDVTNHVRMKDFIKNYYMIIESGQLNLKRRV